MKLVEPQPHGPNHLPIRTLECDYIRSGEFVGEIAFQAGLNGFPDVLPD
jgi:hypothetical protein